MTLAKSLKRSLVMLAFGLSAKTHRRPDCGVAGQPALLSLEQQRSPRSAQMDPSVMFVMQPWPYIKARANER
jgi:hypothetical protein